MSSRSAAVRLVWFLTTGLLLLPSLSNAHDSDGLIDYWGESTWLGSSPGVSSDLAAGLFNPAAYAMADRAGLTSARACLEEGRPTVERPRNTR